MTSQTLDPIVVVDTHLSAYGEPDPERCATLVKEVWAQDGRLIDPPLAATGHEEIVAQAAAVQQHFAGHRFRRVSAVDLHHDRARYGWELVGPDGVVALSGVDVAELDPDDGRLRSIVGFFGELPAKDAADPEEAGR